MRLPLPALNMHCDIGAKSTTWTYFSLFLLTDYKGFSNTCRVASQGCGVHILAGVY